MRSYIKDYISSGTHKDGMIRIEYHPLALNQARNLSKYGINDQAVSRRFEEGISIDGIESLDLDDAIWVEKNKKWYSVFVHISDVTEAVPAYTPLDVEALKRTTSVYIWEGVINMFPPILSQNLLSLNENWEKLTLSIRVDLDDNAEIIDFEVYESLFKNRLRYSYETFIDDFLNPDSKNHSALQLMYEIAQKRKSVRKREWADMSFQDADRQLYIGQHEEKVFSTSKKIPSSIIEEFMILANIASAALCVKQWYNSVFRCHNSVNEKAYYSNQVWFHSWLALENYSHFTSPIRRYADMVLHRVLKLVHLRKESAPYSSWEISEITDHINVSKTIIDILWRDTDRELKWHKIVTKLKSQRGADTLTTSDFTQNIRDTISAGKKIPKVIMEEIIHDLQNGEKWQWAWAIWLFLISKNEEIKEILRKVLLEEKKFNPKAIFSLLNNTKILNTEEEYLFSIEEKTDGNKFTIQVQFQWKLLFSTSINFWKIDPSDARKNLRNKVIDKIIVHFCGK